MFSEERTISGQDPMGRYCCHLGFSCLVWFNSQSHFFQVFYYYDYYYYYSYYSKNTKVWIIIEALSILRVTFNVPEKSI